MKQLIFGITGQTGAGKSTVSKIFEALGVKVINADMVYHSLIKAHMPCTREIAKEFGLCVLSPTGEVDRKKLAKIVFADRDKLTKLNEITHKYIKEKIIEEIGTSPICAIDGAVIIGSQIEELCQYIVCITANEEIRQKRIINRDNIDTKQAKARIMAQNNEEFFVDNSHFVIQNNDDDNLEEQSRSVLLQMLEKEEI